MFEEALLYALQEERLALARVVNSIRAQQLGLAFVGLTEGEQKPKAEDENEPERGVAG